MMGRDFGSEADGEADLRVEFAMFNPCKTSRNIFYPIPLCISISRYYSIGYVYFPPLIARRSAFPLNFSTDDSEKTFRDFIYG